MITTMSGGQTPAPRTRDSERTRREIIAEATREFADRGFSATRVEDVAARTRTTKRMIYYYFGSKAGLFVAVLDEVLGYRMPEPPPALVHDPVSAVRWLVATVLELDEQHPEAARLLSVENVHRGRHLGRSGRLDGVLLPMVTWLAEVLEHGRGTGLFRADVSAVDLLLMVQAVSGHRITHREGIQVLADLDLLDPVVMARQQDLLERMILTYLTG